MRHHPQIKWFHAFDKFADFEGGYYNLKAKIREEEKEIEKLKVAAEFDMGC